MMNPISKSNDLLEQVLEQVQDANLFLWLPRDLALRQVISTVNLYMEGLLKDARYEPADSAILSVPAVDYDLWNMHSDDLDALVNILWDSYDPSGQRFTKVNFLISINSELFPGDFNIQIPGKLGTGETVFFQDDSLHKMPFDSSHYPYLLDTMGNVTHINQVIFNLGRKLDNDLSIPDARISRKHAQIRVTPDEYVIFDLDSTGGTFVNDIRISQHKLQHGDVISLAGFNLVFGVDQPQNPGELSDPVDISETQMNDDDSDLPLEFIG
jgi:hypothetical protein